MKRSTTNAAKSSNLGTVYVLMFTQWPTADRSLDFMGYIWTDVIDLESFSFEFG